MRAGALLLCLVSFLVAGCVPVGIQGKTNRLASEDAAVIRR